MLNNLMVDLHLVSLSKEKPPSKEGNVKEKIKMELVLLRELSEMEWRGH